jgi:hypothetical protein
MMVNSNVLRVSIKGTMPGGEIWSVNPVFQIGGVSTSEPISTDEATAMATAVAALTIPAGLLGTLSSAVNVTGARVEGRTWAGELAALGEAVKASPAGGTGTSPHPFQTSIVISLRTALPGASGRGRIYWPATGLSISLSTLRPSAANVTTAVTAMKTYLTSVAGALNATTDNDCILSVWSR